MGRWGRRRDTLLRKEMKDHVDSSFGYNLGSARIRRKNREGTGVCDIIGEPHAWSNSASLGLSFAPIV